MRNITKTPSYLLKRGDMYYFRCALPKPLDTALGRYEIRCSLGLRERVKARVKAQRAFKAISDIAGSLKKVGDEALDELSLEQVKVMVYESLQKALNDDLQSRHVNGKPLDDLEEAYERSELYDSLAADFQEHLALKRFRHAHNWVDDILEERGMSFPRESLEYRMFAMECLIAASSMFKIISHRYLGDFDFEKGELARLRPKEMESWLVKVDPLEEDKNETEGIALSQALVSYINEKRATQAWVKATEKDMVNALDQFIEIIGDISCPALDKSHVRSYREKILRLPVNYKKDRKLSSLSVDEVLALVDENSPRPSRNTINNKFVKVKGFLSWLERQGYTDKHGIGGVLEGLRASRTPKRSKDLFPDEDIRKIFDPLNLCGKSIKKPYQFWLPLLGLYTGARIEELCQLYVEDVRQEDGVWYLDINNRGTKHVKTGASIRKVPIHHALIEEVDFLAFVEARKGQGEERLFPELPLVTRTGRVSDSASKWFGRYLDRVGVEDDSSEGKKCFHSFRGTFTNYCKQKSMDDKKVKEVVGHAHEGDITEAHYNAPYRVKILYDDVVSRVDFGIDLRSLRKNPFVICEPE